jgi:uncharacterized OsmC-like protein
VAFRLWSEFFELTIHFKFVGLGVSDAELKKSAETDAQLGKISMNLVR